MAETGAGGGVSQADPRDTPDRAVSEFLEAVRTGNDQTAAAMLTPTARQKTSEMQMAVAERGLMVLDCVAHGIAGHAARNEGENAIYKAIRDIANWKKLKNGLLSEDEILSLKHIFAQTIHS